MHASTGATCACTHIHGAKTRRTDLKCTRGHATIEWCAREYIGAVRHKHAHTARPSGVIHVDLLTHTSSARVGLCKLHYKHIYRYTLTHLDDGRMLAVAVVRQSVYIDRVNTTLYIQSVK
jgi:hypothetical protein